MKIISLGHACQVKHHIDNYNYSLYKTHDATNFFDWLITDFRTVLYVVRSIAENDFSFLSRDKFTNKWIYKQCDSWHKPCHKVEHIDIKMISIHEFPVIHPYETCIDDYIETYMRRLMRLKDIILSNNILHFIHMIDHQYTDEYIPTKDDIDKFYNYIYQINPNCTFYLHISHAPGKFLNNDFNRDNLFIYNLESINNVEINWENNDFNWNIIFNKILNC